MKTETTQISNEADRAMVDLVVWGDFACFTRPEFKSERESYPVITPGAARGVLEAIYWKPQMRYRILEIHIHSMGRRFNLLRNELASRQSPNDRNGQEHCIHIDADRQQRTSLVLRNVGYRIKAWIDIRADEPGERIGKHLDCFRRRIETGACHHRPFLGCREFHANFAPWNDERIPPQMRERAKGISDHLGTMLFDSAYVKTGGHQQSEGEMSFYYHRGRRRYQVAGRATRIFFKAEMNDGIIQVPQEKYDEIAKLEGKRWDSTRH